MKIVCHREALLNGVATAANVAPSRTTKAILSGVKISATREGTVALATDLEIAVCSRIQEVITEEPGDVVLTAQTLVEILRSIESDEVTISTEARHCEIRSADAEYKLVTDDPSEFPEIQPVKSQEGVAIPRQFLEEMYSRTAFAAAKDVGRYAINGVLIEMGEGTVRFVATDGRRLAVASRPLPDTKKEKARSSIVPVKALQECLRGSESATMVRLQVEESRVVFSSDLVDVTAKPVEGEFPDYDAVIPREQTGKAIVPRDVLNSAIRKVSVLAGDEMRAIQLRVSENLISVSAQVEGRGQAHTEIEAKTEGSSDLQVDFNPDFVVDYLKPLPSENVVYEYRDGNAAGILRLDGSEDLYVVMPITTN